jgi:type IV pilus assembly protein PilF
MSGRWLGAHVLGSLALLALFSGCAVNPAPTDPREIVTASDQSDADKRSRVRLELAAAYFSRGQGTTALDEVKQALVAKPDSPDAYNLRGLIYASLNQPKLAEESFQRALQLNPRDAETMHNYGYFLCQQKRFAESNVQFTAALAQPQYKDTARTLLTLGICQARSGDWVSAERSLLRSYELDPANPTTAYNLGDVLYRRGEVGRARFYVNRINTLADQSNAQTLWLAARIEQRAGNLAGVQTFGRQLRERFPQSPEALQYERGRFDD